MQPHAHNRGNRYATASKQLDRTALHSPNRLQRHFMPIRNTEPIAPEGDYWANATQVHKMKLQPIRILQPQAAPDQPLTAELPTSSKPTNGVTTN
jgi:hypothetical protein